MGSLLSLRFHKTLTPEKWKSYGYSRQILMVANELNRAGHWITKKDPQEAKNCYERALELLFLTVEVLENKRKLRELLRFRGLVAASFLSAPAFASENQKLTNVLLTLDPASFNMLNPIIRKGI
jgi:hypothetical protein